MSAYHRFVRQAKRTFRDLKISRLLKFRIDWSILTAPFRWFVNSWKMQRLRDLLMGLPALIGIVGIPVLIAGAQTQDGSLSETYMLEANQALSQEDYGTAQLLLSRVLQRNDSHISDARYSMAVLLDETGQKQRASELFKMLAPDDGYGNRDAHRRLAIILSHQITWQSDPQEISRLNWHLTAAREDNSAQMAYAWGRYALATKDLKAARGYFEQAVDEFPELWQTLGQIETVTGDTKTALTSYGKSSEYLSNLLRTDSANQQVRMNYAQVLMKLGQFERAEAVLEQGKQQSPDGPWLQLLAALALNRHDLLAEQGTPIAELLAWIDNALQHVPNYEPALKRLMAYATAETDGNVELKVILARVIAEGKEPALAHLAMGNLCWLEDSREQALFHFERAMGIRKDTAALLNNLAWLLAHEEDPDFDRAMALVNSALKSRPDNASFLDTRGTIYFLQEDWKPALNDFEKALAGVKNPVPLHEKLATIYEHLELPEISKQHRILAGNLSEPTQ